MMNKLFNMSAIYAALSMLAGIFYEIFTKIQGFSGKTSLITVHSHLFAVGCTIFLILLVLEKQFALTKSKLFTPFMIFYNIGVLGLSAVMFYKGIMQVLLLEIPSIVTKISASTHIIFGIGIILMFVLIKKSLKNTSK